MGISSATGCVLPTYPDARMSPREPHHPNGVSSAPSWPPTEAHLALTGLTREARVRCRGTALPPLGGPTQVETTPRVTFRAVLLANTDESQMYSQHSCRCIAQD